MSDRDPAPTFEYRLGVYSKKTKVNMGPIKGVPSLKFNFHRVLIRLGDNVTGLICIHSFRNINHMRKPFYVLFRIWSKLLDKSRSDGHFFITHLIFLTRKRTHGARSTVPVSLANKQEPKDHKNQSV
jgi:hypothetical protein